MPLLVLLNRQRQTLEGLVRLDPSLANHAQTLQNVCLELQELSHTLRLYNSHLQADPQRLQKVDERLTLLNRLKRKYGLTIEALLAYYSQTKAKLDQLTKGAQEIEEVEQRLQTIEKEATQQANELTRQREQSASQLAQALSAELHLLNMPKVECHIQLTERERTREGKDGIEFFLRPNVGEEPLSLKEGISGGELSRVLLALQTLLAGKEQIKTLIFDEVDANIGGKTATIVGNKLQAISEQHQVICITHFPQVAMQAAHHLQISKKEEDGRTLTYVQELDDSTKPLELTRMAGLKT